jgi:hypothetical protein
MFTRYNLVIGMICAALAGCGRPPEASEAAKSSTQSPATKQHADIPATAAQQTPMKNDEQPLPTVTELAPKVSGVRTGTQGRDAVVAMHQLLQQWTPVGKRVEDVKAILGTPSEESATQLVYRFDDEDQAYEWTLPLKNGSIASITKVLHE